MPGIIIAFVAGLFSDVQTRIEEWSKEHNPLFAGPHADLLALVPFVALVLVLYAVARRVSATGRETPAVDRLRDG